MAPSAQHGRVGGRVLHSDLITLVTLSVPGEVQDAGIARLKGAAKVIQSPADGLVAGHARECCQFPLLAGQVRGPLIMGSSTSIFAPLMVCGDRAGAASLICHLAT